MILTVIGARPQFVKAAVVSKALKEYGIEEQIIHTGQHYDDRMSKVFWTELGLPEPKKNLAIGSGTQATQTAKMIVALEEEFINSNPSAILVYGDTNSTLSAALAASKLGIKIIHIEAGLRSFNRTMPEEINRVITDHLSAFLFCSSEQGIKQLEKEGITENVYQAGDVMLDAVLLFSEPGQNKIELTSVLPFEVQPYLLATIHRPANTDSVDNMQEILNAFEQIPVKIVWPLHPRNKEMLAGMKIPCNLHLIPPVSYLEMLLLLNHCDKVCTDSGGLQKEAYWLKKPCITIREETEWIETVHDNWNIITGCNAEKIVNAVSTIVEMDKWYPLYGDGKAASEIAKVIKQNQL